MTHDDHHDSVDDTNPTDDTVGYGRPPKKSQFQKGRSGNLRGRPKGRKSKRRQDLATVLQKLMDEPVTVRDGGRERTMTKRDAAMLGIVHRALGGDQRAMRHLLQLLKETGKLDDKPEVVAGVLRIVEPPLTREEFEKRFGPTSLYTNAGVDDYEKQMLQACELMRKKNREREAWREQTRKRYGHNPGFKLPEF